MVQTYMISGWYYCRVRLAPGCWRKCRTGYGCKVAAEAAGRRLLAELAPRP